jgi:chorismate mutase
MSNLNDFREKIDLIDEKLVKLLATRFQVTNLVGTYKKEHNLPIQDSEREKLQMEKFKKLAEKNKVDPEVIQKIFRSIIDEVLKKHSEIKNS